MVQSRFPIGWPLLPQPDDQGRLNYPSLEESVRESIRIILSTRPNEQLMRPTFGAGLQQFLHQPNTLPTRRRIQELVTESLGRWEPRIVVEKVDVWDLAGEPGLIRVEVAYRLSRNGVRGQVGLTLGLEA